VQSFLTVWPKGEPRPNASANNALPTLVASNAILAKLGADGSVSIFNQQGEVNVVIDVLGYMLPLETANGPGAELLSGAGTPPSTLGNDGDFYVDTTSGVLWGPKTGGAWVTPPIMLGGTQGIASAYNVASPVTITAPTADPEPVTFDTPGPATGSVEITDDTTFTLDQDGLYTVEYHLALTTSVLGQVAVFVNGAQVGPAMALGVGTPNVSDTVLFDAEPGATVQLMFTPAVAGTAIGLGNSSIVVEQQTTM
jgi:hypothetical protein